MEGKKFISHQDWSPIPRIPVHFTRHQSPLYIGPSHCNLTAVPVTHLSPSGHLSDRRMQTVTHTNVHEWRRKGERKKIRSAFNSPLHTNPFWEAEMYSGQKKKKMRQTRVKNVMLNRRHAEWLLRYPVSFKWRYHSEKKGSLVCVPASAHQTATWISLIWRTKEPRFRGAS